jgi:sulfur carrier protein ThiS
MRIQVKLYGTLSRRVPGYRRSEGIELEIPEGATVRELLTVLEIPESQGAVVAVEGRLRKPHENLGNGALVHVFNAFHGG